LPGKNLMEYMRWITGEAISWEKTQTLRNTKLGNTNQ